MVQGRRREDDQGSPQFAGVPERCLVCGDPALLAVDVLPPELVAAWALSEDEAAYVNRQQGLHCERCGSTLRCMALAVAIMRFHHAPGRFADFVDCPSAHGLEVLEINEAGGLTRFLARLPRRRLVEFPATDMQALPFADASFDLVVHSDTLEHVASPARGLAECRRVLRPGGACAFTVPMIVGRLTRRRDGLPPCYHGTPADGTGFLVYTEFGCDAWRCAFEAGFAEVRMSALDPPSAHAMVAVR